MLDRFSWRSYDVNTLMPVDWRDQIDRVVAEAVVQRTLRPRSVTSRESSRDLKIDVQNVDGRTVRERLPWLYGLYKGVFREFAQLTSHEPVEAAKNDAYGVVLNVQTGSAMRYEAHVDSNPIEGLLYLSDLPKGSGGELIVANNPSAHSIWEIDQDCSIVYPTAGHFLLFDARRFPHYVRSLVDTSPRRVVAAMNFYTPSCSEEDRPKDLTPHLLGELS